MENYKALEQIIFNDDYTRNYLSNEIKVFSSRGFYLVVFFVAGKIHAYAFYSMSAYCNG